MMSVILFAIIGHYINAGIMYWACFSVFCLAKSISTLVSLSEDAS